MKFRNKQLFFPLFLYQDYQIFSQTKTFSKPELMFREFYQIIFTALSHMCFS